MITHGDELGRTQDGNNNVYCQDSELSWIDWDNARDHDVLTLFTAQLTSLRAEHPVFRRRRFFDGRPAQHSGLPDVAWFRHDGAPMAEKDWDREGLNTITVFLNGHGIAEPDALGESIIDDSFLVLFNPLLDDVEFTVPDEPFGSSWELIIDAADPLLATPDRDRTVKANGTIQADGQTVLVLRSLY
jgi:glycogen operon protein